MNGQYLYVNHFDLLNLTNQQIVGTPYYNIIYSFIMLCFIID